MKPFYVSVKKAKSSFFAFQYYGASKRELEVALGLLEKDLKGSHRRIPFERYFKMMMKGFELCEPGIAFQMAVSFQKSNKQLIDHILGACNDLEEALRLQARYTKLPFNYTDFELSLNDEQVSLKYLLKVQPFFSPHMVEIALAIALSRIRRVFGSKFSAKEIHFTYPQPAYVEKYEEFFRTPLKFKKSENTILFHKRQLKVLNPNRKSYIKELLVQKAERLLMEKLKRNSFSDEVNQIILDQLPTGSLDIEVISKKLSMSRWTVTRRLNQEGISFRELLNEMKKNLAIGYLENQLIATPEISFLLGYAEVSSFHRAFKTWTGTNPSKFRI